MKGLKVKFRKQCLAFTAAGLMFFPGAGMFTGLDSLQDLAAEYLSADQMLDAFENNLIPADGMDGSQFYLRDLQTDDLVSQGMDCQVGDRVDLDNDGENELTLTGMYGGKFLDAADGKVKVFAQGDGMAEALSYGYYEGAYLVSHQDTSHMGRQVYNFDRYSGADTIVESFTLEEWDTDGGSQCTFKGQPISQEEFQTLVAEIFSTPLENAPDPETGEVNLAETLNTIYTDTSAANVMYGEIDQGILSVNTTSASSYPAILVDQTVMGLVSASTLQDQLSIATNMDPYVLLALEPSIRKGGLISILATNTDTIEQTDITAENGFVTEVREYRTDIATGSETHHDYIYTYDANGRLTNMDDVYDHDIEDDPMWGDVTDYAFTYGDDGRLLSYDVVRLGGDAGGSGTFTANWDGNALVSTVLNFNGGTVENDYAYDSDGRISSCGEDHQVTFANDRVLTANLYGTVYTMQF